MKTKNLIVAAVAAFGCAVTSAAFAHAKLESSSPPANAIVSPSPAQVRLQFNERLELPFSKLKLVDDKGTVVVPSKTVLDEANPKVLVATVPALHSGAYRVQWSTVTRDGHKVKGEFAFRVK
jgi:copper resistance protein C